LTNDELMMCTGCSWIWPSATCCRSQFDFLSTDKSYQLHATAGTVIVMWYHYY